MLNRTILKKIFSSVMLVFIIAGLCLTFTGCGTKAKYIASDNSSDLFDTFNGVGEQNALENVNFKRDGGIDVIYTVHGSVEDNRESIYAALNKFNKSALSDSHFKANYKVVDVISVAAVERTYTGVSESGKDGVKSAATRFILHCPNIKNIKHWKMKEVDVDNYHANQDVDLKGDKDYFYNGVKTDKIELSSSNQRMIYFYNSKSGGVKVTFDKELEGYVVGKDKEAGYVANEHEFQITGSAKEVIFIIKNSVSTNPIAVWGLALGVVIAICLAIVIVKRFV